MYDLSNLNDYEFESLCRDMMEKKLGGGLRLFTRGKDGGIDATTYSGGNDIVIQVKHYFKSNYSSLLTAIKREVKQFTLRQKRIKSYYICTSLALTPANVSELYELCLDYMESTEHIIDELEINKFLKKEENLDIVHKHYKLWLAASNVIDLIYNKNVFLDCEELVNDIEKDMNFYVDTTAYYEALAALERKNILVILGMPGIGKSTLSNMLLFYYLSKGYAVRYSSENNMEDLKRLVGFEDKKEVILLDDFLGQHYLNIREEQSNSIKSLLGMVKKKANKKLIMNSRMTVFNEAKRSSYKFEQLIIDNINHLFYLNLDQMKPIDKAKIFYNHIFFNRMSTEYYDAIIKNKNYRRVIEHRNYNPRIIEYVTKERNYSELLPSQYFDFIMEQLNRPKQIWNDEFKNRITSVDRIFLFTLYSLSNTWCLQEAVYEAFHARLSLESEIDTTINQYEETLYRLKDSMVKTGILKGRKQITVINSSMNDFLFEELERNYSERSKILKSAVFLEQVIQMNDRDRMRLSVIALLRAGDLFKKKVLYEKNQSYLLKCLLKYNLLEASIESNVQELLIQQGFTLHSLKYDFEDADFWLQLLESPLMEFYHLGDMIYLDKKYLILLLQMDYRNAEKLIKGLLLYYHATIHYEHIRADLKDVAAEIAASNLFEKYNDKVYEMICIEFDEKASEITEASLFEGLESYFKGRLEELINENQEEFMERMTYGGIYEVAFNAADIMDKIEYQEMIEDCLLHNTDISSSDESIEISKEQEEDEIDFMFRSVS